MSRLWHQCSQCYRTVYSERQNDDSDGDKYTADVVCDDCVRAQEQQDYDDAE